MKFIQLLLVFIIGLVCVANSQTFEVSNYGVGSTCDSTDPLTVGIKCNNGCASDESFQITQTLAQNGEVYTNNFTFITFVGTSCGNSSKKVTFTFKCSEGMSPQEVTGTTYNVLCIDSSSTTTSSTTSSSSSNNSSSSESSSGENPLGYSNFNVTNYGASSTCSSKALGVSSNTCKAGCLGGSIKIEPYETDGIISKFQFYFRVYNNTQCSNSGPFEPIAFLFKCEKGMYQQEVSGTTYNVLCVQSKTPTTTGTTTTSGTTTSSSSTSSSSTSSTGTKGSSDEANSSLSLISSYYAIFFVALLAILAF